MKDYFHEQNPLHFIFPIDGDCVMSLDGSERDGKFYLRVLINAACTVNGVPAVKTDGGYGCEVPLDGKKTVLTATDGVNTDSVSVFDMRELENKFRISSDDNILFLRDINENKDKYRSIFENPYLAMYKKVHDLYGAKVDLNLFYETDDMPNFNGDRGAYFNLSMMTDKFKDEFTANADWLRLSFHANSEHPDRPYMYASPRRITEDALRVHTEILRFAGPAVLSKTATVHWGEADRECTQAMRDMGYKALAGYFEIHKEKPFVAYYYPVELINHIGARDFWVNTEDGILHSRIDLVLNMLKSYDELAPELAKICEEPHRTGFFEFMIHEQYFYDNYSHYEPYFGDVVLDAAKFAYERGCESTFLNYEL